MVRRFTKHVFLTFFIAIVVVFIAGLLLGRYMERSAENEVKDFLQENELITESYLLEQALIRNSGEEGCDLARVRTTDLFNQLGMTGKRLSDPEAGEILGERSYTLLKRQYHLMQIRTFLLFQQLSGRCGIQDNVVLYYYGPDGGQSTRQGMILDELVLSDGIIVFAVEYNFSSELSFMEQYYNITSTPSIVLNYNKTYKGVAEKEDILPFLR